MNPAPVAAAGSSKRVACKEAVVEVFGADTDSLDPRGTLIGRMVKGSVEANSVCITVTAASLLVTLATELLTTTL